MEFHIRQVNASKRQATSRVIQIQWNLLPVGSENSLWVEFPQLTSRYFADSPEGQSITDSQPIFA
jgi:hypothetical protein